MAKKIVINGIHFKSQKDAIDYTRNVLISLEGISEVTTTNENWDYLNELILRHPEYETKTGKGITSIVIVRDRSRNIAMNLKRVDGSIVDISWIHCVKSTSATPDQNLMSAMRFAVKWQIKKFRNNAEKSVVICGICSNAILPTDETHVDHHSPTFKVLAENFIKENSPPDRFDDDPITNQAKFSASDYEYSKRWQDYHLKHAELRLTHARCNRSRKR